MKVESMFNTFNSYGEYCKYVKVGKLSPYTNVLDELMLWNKLIIDGEELLLQQDEVRSVIKKLIKNNDSIKIDLYINNLKYCIKLNNILNVTYNVFIPMKNTNMPYEVRISNKTLTYYNSCCTRFIFVINSMEEIDEANMIVINEGLNKNKVYLQPNDLDYENIRNLSTLCKHYHFNMLVPIDKYFNIVE